MSDDFLNVDWDKKKFSHRKIIFDNLKWEIFFFWTFEERKIPMGIRWGGFVQWLCLYEPINQSINRLLPSRCMYSVRWLLNFDSAKNCFHIENNLEMVISSKFFGEKSPMGIRWGGFVQWLCLYEPINQSIDHCWCVTVRDADFFSSHYFFLFFFLLFSCWKVDCFCCRWSIKRPVR